ncbi:MAG: hypothetical protein ACRDSK_00200 [Actinophytocola sp.]|uniref:hypothetical protein n=1 Tax=Actinophytocola sp. TaxID=1872138 RepID=UPI003D6AF683
MSELEFAEYRLMMRAGVRPARAPVASYYLVGFVQGVRRGGHAADHDALARTIHEHDSAAVLHRAVTSFDELNPVAELHRHTALAAASTMCVAWLPDRQGISEAGAELQAAHRGGSTVVAITEHRDDLLVRAFASVILPDLPAFGEWLAGQPHLVRRSRAA